MAQQLLEERHALIWHGEQVFAHALAKQVINKPKVTVWIILLPLLFLFFMQDLKKYKNGIRDFVEGFLKNKKIALDLAFNAVVDGASLEKTVAAFGADSRPDNDAERTLHQKQMREIECLAAHFRQLLNSNGQTYEALVRNSYISPGKYKTFQDRLFELESAVIEAALQARPSEIDTGALVTQMQSAMRDLRRQQRDHLFKS